MCVSPRAQEPHARHRRAQSPRPQPEGQLPKRHFSLACCASRQLPTFKNRKFQHPIPDFWALLAYSLLAPASQTRIAVAAVLTSTIFAFSGPTFLLHSAGPVPADVCVHKHCPRPEAAVPSGQRPGSPAFSVGEQSCFFLL